MERMGLGKGEGSGKEARSSWGGEIFATPIYLPLQEEVQGPGNLGLLSWDQVHKQGVCSWKWKP